MKENKLYEMKFSMLYPLYVSKAEKKGRHAEEVDEVICWLTGYTQSVQAIDELAKGKGHLAKLVYRKQQG